jgi:hypothetical protein
MFRATILHINYFILKSSILVFNYARLYHHYFLNCGRDWKGIRRNERTRQRLESDKGDGDRWVIKIRNKSLPVWFQRTSYSAFRPVVTNMGAVDTFKWCRRNLTIIIFSFVLLLKCVVSLLSSKRKVRLMRSPVCLSVCPSVCVPPNNVWTNW